MQGLFQSSPVLTALASNKTFTNSILNYTIYPSRSEERYGMNVLGFPLNDSFTDLSTLNYVVYQSYYGFSSSLFDRHILPSRATFYSNYLDYQQEIDNKVIDWLNYNGLIQLQGSLQAKFKSGSPTTDPNNLFKTLISQGSLVELNCSVTGTLNGTVYSKSDLALYFGDFTFNYTISSLIDYWTVNSLDSVNLDNPIVHQDQDFILISASKFSITSNVNLTTFAHLNTTGNIGFRGTSSFLTTIDPFTDSETLYAVKNTITNISIITFIGIMLGVIIMKWKSRPKWTPRVTERIEREQAERASNFIEAYPPNTEFMELTKLPTFTLLNIKDYEFYEPVPQVIVGGLYGNGKQRIKIKARQVVTLQTNKMLNQVGISPPPSYESTELPECFYSLRIDQIDKDAIVGIGFATRPYPPFRLPGTEDISIGYHSSGSILYNKTKIDAPKAQQNSVIGVGYRRVERIRVYNHVIYDFVFFFVVDGVRIGDEFICDGEKFYPTLGTNGNCKLLVDFGSTNVFE
ncbi:Rsp5p-dependent ubiquitination, sorting of cargo proteins at the multivesicular body [Boothiomyces sp. JEL0866]|nr:Rsp5p-dependent ubiquitination, sorting of cargo proteins at the multivesicular body [Boothiomyces sp. JEL0866]